MNWGNCYLQYGRVIVRHFDLGDIEEPKRFPLVSVSLYDCSLELFQFIPMSRPFCLAMVYTDMRAVVCDVHQQSAKLEARAIAESGTRLPQS